MYVDKKLAGVAAVQTLSRLNRTYPNKDQTYVIDFVNSAEDIKAAFQPYYETAELADVSDPYIIIDLQQKLDDKRIYTPEEINNFVEAFFKGKQSEMQARIAPAVERYRVKQEDAQEKKDKLTIDELDLFRKDMTGFIRSYDFLSQIVNYADTDLEKRAIFFKHLLPWLKTIKRGEQIDLSAVNLTHYKLSNAGKQAIKLGAQTEDDKLSPVTAVGTGQARDPHQVLLSQIIEQMNDLFEGEIDDNDKLALVQHVASKMLDNAKLAQQASANTKEQFGASPDYKYVMMESVAEGLDRYTGMAKQVLNSSRVQDGLAEMLLELVYAEFAKKRGDGNVDKR